MKRYILACLTVVVVFGGLVSSVRADDVYPPWWLRGQPWTTWQDWDFWTSANPDAADSGLFNLYGNPTATIAGGVWSQSYDNHVGVWTIGPSNSMVFHVPCPTVFQSPYGTSTQDPALSGLFVWVQITSQGAGTNWPVVTVAGNDLPLCVLLYAPVGNGSWLQSVYENMDGVGHTNGCLGTLRPVPDAVDVVIGTGGPERTFAIGQVVIDAIYCIADIYPRLSITRSGGDVIATWLTNYTGFTLQSTTNLVPTVVWTTLGQGTIVNANYVVTNAISGKQMFYRLERPG